MTIARTDRLMSRVLIVLLSLSLLAVALPAAAEEDAPIHRCRGADGVVSFSDYPCPSDARSEPMAPARTQPESAIAGIQAQCGRVADNAGSGFSDEFRAGLPDEQAEGLTLALKALDEAGAPGYRWARSSRGDLHLCASSRRGEALELVAAEGGEVVRFRGGIGQFLNDPETPQALRNRCRRLVSACVSPERTVDSCVQAAPVCEVVPPWAGGSRCCPEACKQAHARLRGEGNEPMEAFLRMLDERPGCVGG